MNPNDYRALQGKQGYENSASKTCSTSAAVGNYAQGCDLSGASVDMAYRPGIRDRVDLALRDATRANERANVAAEIGFLLDKNPDFARLLDLIDRF